MDLLAYMLMITQFLYHAYRYVIGPTLVIYAYSFQCVTNAATHASS